MKSKLLLLFFLGLTPSQWLLADPVQVIDRPQSDSVYRDSSAFNRINKSFSINYIALGLGPSRSGTIGLNLGFFLDRNSLIDLEVVNGRPLYTSWFTSSEYDIKTNSFGVHYKHFAGNSFYYRIGVDYRNVDYTYISRDIFTSAELSRSRFKGSSVTATVLIGNQWQWENFTLGCDWIGAAVPITSQTDSESVTGTSPNPNNLADDKNNLLNTTASLALRFYLGASF